MKQNNLIKLSISFRQKYKNLPLLYYVLLDSRFRTNNNIYGVQRRKENKLFATKIVYYHPQKNHCSLLKIDKKLHIS